MIRVNRSREGIALLLAVVVLVLLTMVTTGLLFVGSREKQVARARGAALRARLAAESGARAALAAWTTDELSEMVPGELRPLPAAAGRLPGGGSHRAVVERLAGPLFLVRARGDVVRPDGIAAQARAGLLVRTLDLRELWRAFPAALALGGSGRVESGAQVQALRPMQPPLPWRAADCPTAAVAPFDTLFPSRARPALVVPDAASLQIAPGTIVDGRPSVLVDPVLAQPDAFDHLGPLGWQALRRLADRVESGAIQLEARAASGRCDRSAPGNWGDPDDPTGPCGNYFPFILAPGGLEITGGAGQGILMVDGDLVLRPGVRLYGVIFVRGRLLAPDGATIFGAVRARSTSGPSLWGGGRVSYRACAIGRALAATPAQGRPFRPAARWWVPLF